MPRTSRHKSSKHGSRDARDYSDSEKDSSSKDRKSKDETSAKVSKESGSSEKRKLDSRDNNGVYEHSTSKRRKERVDDGNDRWNGGDDDRGEGTKMQKDKLSESKSKRREDNPGAYGESDDVVKKSGGKSEGKHRESSSRKEGREGGGERERNKEREREKENERYRRSKEGKSEKLIEVDDMRTMKQVSEKSELSARQSPEMDSLPDRRSKKRDDFDNGDKNHDEFGDRSDRRLSSRDDITKNGRPKDEKHKDDRYRDKYREDVDRESRHRDDKQRDERAGKDHNKSVDKISRDHKDSVETRPKKPKPHDGDSPNERDDDHESYQRERDRDRDREHDRDRDWERDRDRERERDRDRNFDDYDDRSARYKDSRGRKRSPDDYDDYADTKSRGVKTACPDTEKRSMSSRVESDADRVKSHSSQAHADNIGGSSRRRTSPSTSSLGAADEYRNPKQEDLKYKDSGIEHRSSKSMSSRDERNSKYRSNEKHSKTDEGVELSVERSSSSKASPMGLVDRSPSSTNPERRYSNRPGVRRTLDIEESGKRSNTPMGSRDFPSADDRPNRDLPSEKDDSTSVPIPPPYRSRVGSPSFTGPQEEDGRFGSGSRYKRSGGDHNLPRGQGNAWRGPPNWPSPLPNGYMPFQHGPHHGAFPAMLPQFPSLFGVRPSMEINPYHISDADRFGSHMRPLGWQNMMDSSGPAHMWDELHRYGGPDWDQARHSMSGRGWEGNADVWKGQNGDMNLEMPNIPSKEDFPAQPLVEELSVGQRSQEEGATNTKTSVAPLENDSGKTPARATPEESTDLESEKPTEKSNDDPYYAYLSQLDISAELVDPEFYDQFAALLKVKQSETAQEDHSILVNLKDGGRAVPKSSSSLSSSLFPATSASVFQRALGIYKRQRSNFGGLPFADGGTVDAILESKEVTPNNEPIPEEPVANRNDEMSEETNPNVAAPEVSKFSPIKEAEVDAESPDPMLESPDKPATASIISEMDAIASNEPVDSEDKGEIEVLPSLITKGENILMEDVICKTETLSRDGKCGPLGSPESGTNESESVNLSRIHHSPKSTH